MVDKGIKMKKIKCQNSTIYDNDTRIVIYERDCRERDFAISMNENLLYFIDNDGYVWFSECRKTGGV